MRPLRGRPCAKRMLRCLNCRLWLVAVFLVGRFGSLPEKWRISAVLASDWAPGRRGHPKRAVSGPVSLSEFGVLKHVISRTEKHIGSLVHSTFCFALKYFLFLFFSSFHRLFFRISYCGILKTPSIAPALTLHLTQGNIWTVSQVRRQ